MFEDEAATAAKAIINELGWQQPWYLASAISREGTWTIMQDVMAFFDHQREQTEPDGPIL
jgi:GTP-binding protein